MYPPEKEDDIHEAVGNLWRSLNRAAEGQLIGMIGLDEEEEGYLVTFGLNVPVPVGVKRQVSSYIRAYTAACGWKVSDVLLNRNSIRFQLVKDASSML